MISFIEYAVPFLFAIVLLVVWHEFGHYLAARACKVHVETFSFGFGPVLFRRVDRVGTTWQCAALPLGGFVKMRGEMTRTKASSRPSDPTCFEDKTNAQKAFIVVAGPLANFVLAALLFVFMFALWGGPITSLRGPITIDSIQEDSPAARAGLQSGDIITQLNGAPIANYTEFQEQIQRNEPIMLAIRRPSAGTTTLTQVRLVPQRQEDGVARIGIVPNTDLSLGRATQEGIKMVWTVTSLTVQGLSQLVTGEISRTELAGPIRIVQYSRDFAVAGARSFVFFLAILSVNLGLLNLLPIPVLDGGRLVLIGAEAVLRRPLPEAAQGMLMRIGVLLIIGLLIFVTINDIGSL